MRLDHPVLLYGAGREARSTRQFLREIAPKTKVFVTVDSGEADIEDTEIIAPADLESALTTQQFATIIKSPGVSLYKPIFASARALGIEVTSNLNVWHTHFGAGRDVIAITGTKGKSTTATLVHLMLTHSGIDAGLAGNVGVPPLDVRDHHPTVVLELSSYQTADMNFAPSLVGLTNLYPEHVDWHGSLDTYYRDKLNLIDRDGDFRVALGSVARNMDRVEKAIHHNTGRIMVLDTIMDDAVAAAVAKSKLKGAHNLENARLAARLTLAAGGTLDGVVAGITDFSPLPHRLEAHTIGGLTFVNDSISTTPEATKVALSAYRGSKIALFIGGQNRQQDYKELADLLTDAGVVKLICLPDTGHQIADLAQTSGLNLQINNAPNLASGMHWLAAQDRDFDCILLSPAAPSYNQFKNFEDRGQHFIELAKTVFDTTNKD